MECELLIDANCTSRGLSRFEKQTRPLLAAVGALLFDQSLDKRSVSDFSCFQTGKFCSLSAYKCCPTELAAFSCSASQSLPAVSHFNLVN